MLDAGSTHDRERKASSGICGRPCAFKNAHRAGAGLATDQFPGALAISRAALLPGLRDVKVRYKQTALGAAWAILQPAMLMVVFTIFFGRMANVPTADIPYPLFAYAGLVPWTFFATAITSAGNSVVGSERLITKIYFPRLAIPFAAVGAALVDFFIALSLLVAMMIYYGIAPGPGLLLVPVFLALLTLAALGVGTLLGALNVYYRDFRYVVPFLVQIWMFATPSVYMQPKADAGGLVQTIMALNPVNRAGRRFPQRRAGPAHRLGAHCTGQRRLGRRVPRRLPLLPQGRG